MGNKIKTDSEQAASSAVETGVICEPEKHIGWMAYPGKFGTYCGIEDEWKDNREFWNDDRIVNIFKDKEATCPDCIEKFNEAIEKAKKNPT